MKRMQRGFIDIPKGFFETLFVLAGLGLVALLCLGGYGLWWLLTHITFTG